MFTKQTSPNFILTAKHEVRAPERVSAFVMRVQGCMKYGKISKSKSKTMTATMNNKPLPEQIQEQQYKVYMILQKQHLAIKEILEDERLDDHDKAAFIQDEVSSSEKKMAEAMGLVKK